MKKFNNNTTTNALVKEVLSKDDVMSLFDMTLTRNGKVDDHVSIYKGTFTTWCGDTHEGYIVCHDTIDASDKHEEKYYFMEVTLEEVIDNMVRSYHLWKPTFHMLLPITENYKRKPVLPEKANTKDLCSYIIANAYRDEWDYVYVPMTEQEIKKYGWYNRNAKTIVPLTYNDIVYDWETPLTEEEQAQRQAAKKAKEKSLIDLFNDSELPEPESDPWYGILSMGYGTEGYDLECKVIKMLKNRGYNVRIDGERDSFGWVTRGIFIDDQIMAIY
jgi:hypothetical protein